MTPIVHLYATCWNDEPQLEFFFRHYDPIVDRYTIFDDGSTDRSVELLRAHPKVQTKRFVRSHAESFVLSELDLFNHCWKESRDDRAGERADWVIVCSIDEHLVHPNFTEYLTRCSATGVTVIPALGYQMFTDVFPNSRERLSRTRQLGVPDPYDCKLSLFSPAAIQEINYEPGGHIAAPIGRVLAPAHNEMVLLHYQLLGIEYTLRRFDELRTGLGPVDRAQQWGVHYEQSRADLENLWVEYRMKAVDTSLEPSTHYEPPAWWDRFPRL